MGADNPKAIQVVARAIKVLRSLSTHSQGMSLAEIASEVDLPRGTVQRIIATLEAEDFVEPVGPRGGVRIGPALGKMIFQTQAEIIFLVRKHLEKLSLDLNETVFLSRLIGRDAHILDQVVSNQTLRIVIPLGVSVPLHLTADGKALLALMSREQMIERLRQTTQRTKGSSKSVERLIAELDEVRRTGVAYDYEELDEGICGVAIAIDTYLGAYAICILTPAHRMKKNAEKFKAALLDTQSKLNHLIGITKSNSNSNLSAAK